MKITLLTDLLLACSISQAPRTKRQLPVAIVEESLNTINVFGDEMDINITCIVVGEFGFDSRTVTVSTICEKFI